MHEVDQGYVYSLGNCLSQYGSIRDDLTPTDVRVRLAAAYNSFEVPDDYFINQDPLEFNSMIASKAAAYVIRNDGIDVFRTILHLQTDEPDIDGKLEQWKNFGVFEGSVRSVLIECLKEEYDGLAEDITEQVRRKKKWFEKQGPRREGSRATAENQQRQIMKIISSLETKRSRTRLESGK